MVAVRHEAGRGGGGDTGELAVDLGATGEGVVELLEDQDPAAAGDDEAVACLVKGARRCGGRVVVLGRQRTHAVEHGGKLEAVMLAGAGHDDVGLQAGAGGPQWDRFLNYAARRAAFRANRAMAKEVRGRRG